jgi:hypothetical protein
VADIFLSYARADTDRANAIVRALRGAGLSVWFDRYTPTASRWEGILRRELEHARCVVVLWSDHAAKSRWVREEGLVGLERAALVPVRIGASDIPEQFASVQFADLISWNDDPTAPAFTELLECIRSQMLPRCRICFDSLFRVSTDDLRELFDAYIHISGRLGCVPVPGSFVPPSTPDERRRLHRAVASLQVSIQWDPTLESWYADSSRRDLFLDRVGRIERQIPLIWLRLLTYSGPFFDSASSPRTHAHFLSFASLMFFHEMFSAARRAGQRLDVPPPLTSRSLRFPRWEGTISAIFEDRDEIAVAYVTHIDDSPLPREETFYGPRYSAQKAYGKSLRRFPFTDPILLERYVIPQRELRLALEGTTQHTEYGGNVRIRKITDLNGNDLEPLND